MYSQYYREAREAGQKEYRRALARGEYPYLNTLDSILPQEKIASGVAVGEMQIPMEQIVGTKSGGRTEAFARNFMPLLDDHSEFAAKWIALCGAHVEEGVRDAVRVYEYMNRYYVEEGNKRVSVLRFFNAVSVPAEVIRILPERIPENEPYYEFLAFVRVSGVNFIELSKKGAYADLQSLMGKEPGEQWTEEERRRFSSDYYYFKAVYEKVCGSRLDSTAGDAMLTCIRVYGYEALHSMGTEELKTALNKMWEEMQLQQDPDPIELKTDPAGEVRPGLWERMLGAGAPKELKIAFLYDRDPEVSGWVRGHELGRLHVQRVFGNALRTFSRVNVMEGDPNEEIGAAIAEGADVVFTTSPRLLDASLRAAVEHPQVIVLNCSLNTSHRYIRTYYARMYEAKFIAGALAGAMSQSGRVGYVCDYPIWGQIAGINAFALGLQMIDPRARVYLEWSSVGDGAEAVRRLRDRGIELISSQDMARLSAGSRSSFGLSRINAEGSTLLAAPIWNWGVYYEGMIRSILNHSLQREYESSKKALNYYWGMSAGVVDLELSDGIPAGVKKLARNLKAGICADVIRPFTGPIVRQDGNAVGEENVSLSMEEIIRMDYLVENVTGSIPKYNELSDVARATVDTVGVFSAQRPAAVGEERT